MNVFAWPITVVSRSRTLAQTNRSQAEHLLRQPVRDGPRETPGEADRQN